MYKLQVLCVIVHTQILIAQQIITNVEGFAIPTRPINPNSNQQYQSSELFLSANDSGSHDKDKEISNGDGVQRPAPQSK